MPPFHFKNTFPVLIRKFNPRYPSRKGNAIVRYCRNTVVTKEQIAMDAVLPTMPPQYGGILSLIILATGGQVNAPRIADITMIGMEPPNCRTIAGATETTGTKVGKESFSIQPSQYMYIAMAPVMIWLKIQAGKSPVP